LSLRYTLREAINGFAGARVSSFISVSTVAFLLFFTGLFFVLSRNLDHLIVLLKARVDVQVFLSISLDDGEIANLGAKLMNLEGVKEVEFISKELAARSFEQEFGHELFDILEENPLPASFIIHVDEDYRTGDSIRRIAGEAEMQNGVDEVVYHSQALDLLTRFAETARFATILLLLLVTLGSLFVISNTTRLIILARRHHIETMKLVGATNANIRRPFLIEGVFQGTLGGVIAMVAAKFFIEVVHAQWPGVIYVSTGSLVLLIVLGFVFGFLGSFFAVRQFI